MRADLRGSGARPGEQLEVPAQHERDGLQDRAHEVRPAVAEREAVERAPGLGLVLRAERAHEMGEHREAVRPGRDAGREVGEQVVGARSVAGGSRHQVRAELVTKPGERHASRRADRAVQVPIRGRVHVDGRLSGGVAAVADHGCLQRERPASALRDHAAVDVPDADRAGALVHAARDHRETGREAERLRPGSREPPDHGSRPDDLGQTAGIDSDRVQHRHPTSRRPGCRREATCIARRPPSRSGRSAGGGGSPRRGGSGGRSRTGRARAGATRGACRPAMSA